MGLIMLPLVLPEIIVAMSLLVVLAGHGDQPVDPARSSWAMC